MQISKKYILPSQIDRIDKKMRYHHEGVNEGHEGIRKFILLNFVTSFENWWGRRPIAIRFAYVAKTLQYELVVRHAAGPNRLTCSMCPDCILRGLDAGNPCRHERRLPMAKTQSNIGVGVERCASFSCSVGERKLMKYFVVNFLFFAPFAIFAVECFLRLRLCRARPSWQMDRENKQPSRAL